MKSPWGMPRRGAAMSPARISIRSAAISPAALSASASMRSSTIAVSLIAGSAAKRCAASRFPMKPGKPVRSAVAMRGHHDRPRHPVYGGPMERDAALEAVFTPVRTPTTFEETVERLGTAIRLGLLTPGSRLPAERDLAGELGISRSTLRQALRALTQSGHLTSTRGRTGGTFVVQEPPLAEPGALRPSPAPPLDESAHAILDLRVAIETGAVILAVERSEEQDLERLEEVVARMAEARNFEEYRRGDVRFHIGIAEAARSERLVAEMTRVQSRMSELIAGIAHPDVVLTRSNAQHRRLLRLLGKRDLRG